MGSRIQGAKGSHLIRIKYLDYFHFVPVEKYVSY
jgi:hypothetical protein